MCRRLMSALTRLPTKPWSAGDKCSQFSRRHLKHIGLSLLYNEMADCLHLAASAL